MITIETFVPILDLGGTFVFAISGAVAAVNRRLDIFGILVLSFVTGNFGGITRDLLIGAVPPAVLRDGRYLLVSVLAGFITFFWYAGVDTSAQPRAPVRRGRTIVLCSRRRAKGDRVRVEPSNVSTSGHVDRHRRWHDARRATRGGPPGAAFRSLRRCSVGRRGHRCDRRHARVFPMASQLWQERTCASAFASWRSGTAGICRSHIFPRGGALKQILRMIRQRGELSPVEPRIRISRLNERDEGRGAPAALMVRWIHSP